MEDKKAKIDLRKTYLNHIMVILVGLGSYVFSSYSKGHTGLFPTLGVIGLVIAVIIYGIISISAEQTIKDMK